MLRKCPACGKRLRFKQVLLMSTDQSRTTCESCGEDLVVTIRGKVPLIFFAIFLVKAGSESLIPVVVVYALAALVVIPVAVAFVSVKLHSDPSQ